ncbi:carbohydrate-binding module family 21 protein [Mucor lusitanicus]|uniref:Carbohydrate-binding module family 21 protein n=2 Tax=Mucor circinelloides f. lusitanicus TaxID=29924 RepID=A0A168PK62_MUCCL|nr:carbohydrate-binding module family 21 protein [Mucor lusitanicus]OAD07843.1 carbohydrate-binding module family 21 protein [Mucor lusitanicus CBS 277.49]
MSTTTTTSNLHHHFLHIPQQQDMAHKRVALIKRPPLVRSCSPNLSEGLHRTASNASLNKYHRKPKKSVRFCDNASLENVRLFLKTQMPKACRSDPACLNKQYTFRIRRPNWPSSALKRRNSDGGAAVRLEDVQLSKQQQQQQDAQHVTLLGSIQVANLAFQKRVIVRYTLDDWNTAKEVEAQYQEPIAHSANTWDRFSFKIVLDANTHAAHESLYLAVKYNVNGREFWDNNNHKNYQVDIVPDVELDLEDASSNSSSSSDDDDDHIFEDCITHEEEEEDGAQEPDIQELQQKLHLTNLKERYDFNNASTQKPWSPPLSPTTPADTTPLWVGHNSNNSTNNNYFASKTATKKDETVIPDARSSDDSTTTTASQFHHLIHKYCFYNDHKKPSVFTPYHSDPPRCSSPKPKAIRS